MWTERSSGVGGEPLVGEDGDGVGVLAHQTALLEGRASAAFEPHALLRVATQTQSGLVWLVRLGLLLVAGVFDTSLTSFVTANELIYGASGPGLQRLETAISIYLTSTKPRKPPTRP